MKKVLHIEKEETNFADRYSGLQDTQENLIAVYQQELLTKDSEKYFQPRIKDDEKFRKIILNIDERLYYQHIFLLWFGD